MLCALRSGPTIGCTNREWPLLEQHVADVGGADGAMSVDWPGAGERARAKPGTGGPPHRIDYHGPSTGTG